MALTQDRIDALDALADEYAGRATARMGTASRSTPNIYHWNPECSGPRRNKVFTPVRYWFPTWKLCSRCAVPHKMAAAERKAVADTYFADCLREWAAVGWAISPTGHDQYRRRPAGPDTVASVVTQWDPGFDKEHLELIDDAVAAMQTRRPVPTTAVHDWDKLGAAAVAHARISWAGAQVRDALVGQLYNQFAPSVAVKVLNGQTPDAIRIVECSDSGLAGAEEVVAEIIELVWNGFELNAAVDSVQRNLWKRDEYRTQTLIPMLPKTFRLDPSGFETSAEWLAAELELSVRDTRDSIVRLWEDAAASFPEERQGFVALQNRTPIADTFRALYRSWDIGGFTVFLVPFEVHLALRNPFPPGYTRMGGGGLHAELVEVLNGSRGELLVHDLQAMDAVAVVLNEAEDYELVAADAVDACLAASSSL